MDLKGSIVNQIKIKGFADQKDSDKFRKKIKSLKSIFHLSKIDKSINFYADEASWKMKDDFSLIYLFLTEDSFPEEEISALSRLKKDLSISHLVIAPSEEGLMLYYHYENSELLEKTEVKGGTAHMLGDLIQGGFQ